MGAASLSFAGEAQEKGYADESSRHRHGRTPAVGVVLRVDHGHQLGAGEEPDAAVGRGSSVRVLQTPQTLRAGAVVRSAQCHGRTDLPAYRAHLCLRRRSLAALPPFTCTARVAGTAGLDHRDLDFKTEMRPFLRVFLASETSLKRRFHLSEAPEIIGCFLKY